MFTLYVIVTHGGGHSLLYSSEYRAGLNRLDMVSSSIIIQKQHFDSDWVFFTSLVPILFCKIKTFSKAGFRQ